MRIVVTSVMVDDQQKALEFYTTLLGFVKKHDIPLPDGNRWLTVVSPEAPDGVELLLEPSDNPCVKPFKKALMDQGIPFTSFEVDDVEAEYERLKGCGVKFTLPPTDAGTVSLTILEDTCGNLIQLVTPKKA